MLEMFGEIIFTVALVAVIIQVARTLEEQATIKMKKDSAFFQINLSKNRK